MWTSPILPVEGLQVVNLSAKLGQVLVTFGPDTVNGVDFVDGGGGNDKIVLTGFSWSALGFEVGKNIVPMNPNTAANNGSFSILAISTTTTTDDTIEVATASLTADTGDTQVDFVQVDSDAGNRCRGLRSSSTGTWCSVHNATAAAGPSTGVQVRMGLATDLILGWANDGTKRLASRLIEKTQPPDSKGWWMAWLLSDATFVDMLGLGTVRDSTVYKTSAFTETGSASEKVALAALGPVGVVTVDGTGTAGVAVSEGDTASPAVVINASIGNELVYACGIETATGDGPHAGEYQIMLRVDDASLGL